MFKTLVLSTAVAASALTAFPAAAQAQGRYGYYNDGYAYRDYDRRYDNRRYDGRRYDNRRFTATALPMAAPLAVLSKTHHAVWPAWACCVNVWPMAAIPCWSSSTTSM